MRLFIGAGRRVGSVHVDSAGILSQCQRDLATLLGPGFDIKLPSEQQQILALGRLAWSLRRIEQASPCGARPSAATSRRPASPCIAAVFVLTLGCSRKSVRLVWRSSAQIWPSCTSARFVPLRHRPRDRPRQSEWRRPHTRHLRSRAQSAVSRRARAPRRRRAPVPYRRSRSERQSRSGCRPHPENPLRGLASRVSKRQRVGRIHGSTARRNDRSPRCLLRNDPRSGRCRSNRFAITATASAGPSRWLRGSRGRRLRSPTGWIGRRVLGNGTSSTSVVAPKTGQLLREHLRAPPGWHRLHDEDRPARTPASTIALLVRPKTAGPHISAVCEYIHQH